MSGFAWPSAAPGAPQSPVVSHSSGLKSRSSSAMSHYSKSQSTASLSAATTSSRGRRTVHIQVTHTVTVTPQLTMTVSAAKYTPPCTSKHPGHFDGMVISLSGRSAQSAPQRTTHVKVTRTIVKTPSADPTGAIFQMYTTPADVKQTSSSAGTNHAAIIGGIASVIIFAVVALVAYVVLRNKCKSANKRPDAESGRARCHDARSTDEAINNARRMRSERHRRNREAVNHPHAWNAADTIEMTHQNNAIAAETHVRNIRGAGDPASSSTHGGMDPTQLAQVHAFETSFAADDFSSRNKYASRLPTKHDARRPPPIVTQPVKASRQRSHRAQAGAYSKIGSPVSPLAKPAFASRIPRPRGSRTFADVSPLSSPGRSRGHGWPR
jgi:hypothetical protein